LTGEDGIVCKVVYNDQDLKEFFVAPLLKEVCDFMLGIEDVGQGIGVVVIEIYWLLYGVSHLHALLYVLLNRPPGLINLDGGAEDVDPAEAVAVDV